MVPTSHHRFAAWLWLLALLVLLLLAAVLRIYRLGTLPAGLHFDEAANGMLALRIVDGERPVFLSPYSGREPGFHYLAALSIALLGQNILAIRLPSALLGVGMVLALFLVGQRILYGRFGALLAAGATAGASWLLHVNRIGFRANLLPLLLTLWAWLMLRAMESNRRRDWLSAGALLGLTAYTYLAARFVPLLIVLLLGYLLIWHRPLLHQCWRGLVLLLLTAFILVTPLLLHFLAVPADWSERFRQVGGCTTFFSLACQQQIIAHFWETVLMIGVHGDPLGFFNLPGSPALPAPAGWLFYVGLLLALYRFREPRMALLLLWWLVMIMPGVLSMDSPHFLRTIGAAPATMLLWALPLVSLQSYLLSAEAQTSRAALVPRWLLPLIGASLVLFIAVVSAYNYFGPWAARPELHYEYMGYATDAAQAVNQLPNDVDLFISEDYYRHATYLYLAPRTAQAHWFDIRVGWPSAREDRRSLYLISWATPTDERIEPFLEGGTIQPVVNEHGQYSYTLLEFPAGMHQMPEPDMPLVARVGGLRLTGYTIHTETPDDALRVSLFWQVQEPAPREQWFFLHLIDAEGKLVAQHDTPGYPSPEWQEGDQFATLHTIALPTAPLSGEHALLLGLYDEASGERLPATAQATRDGDVVLPLTPVD